MTLKLAAVCAVLLAAPGCRAPSPATLPQDFTVLHISVPMGWDRTNASVLQHASGACFVALEGRVLVVVDRSVCGYYSPVKDLRPEMGQ